MEQTTKRFRKRDAILRCIRSTDVHPSAEWIYEQVRRTDPDISLATVYRNLALFKQTGQIVSLGTVGQVERFDANTQPHVHFICQRCDAVIDLPHMAVPQTLSSQAAAQAGGTVRACHLTFTGLCDRCARQKKKKN